MRGQSHLTISQDPHNWQLAPPVMYGLCGAEVQNPTPVDTFTAEHGRVPEFNPLTTCAKCIAIAQTKSAYTEDDQSGDLTPAAFYVYAISDRREIEKYQGRTITDLEEAVTEAGQPENKP